MTIREEASVLAQNAKLLEECFDIYQNIFWV